MFSPLQTLLKDNLNTRGLRESGNVALKDVKNDNWALLDHVSRSSPLEVPAYHLQMHTDFLDSLCLIPLFKIAPREVLITAKSSQKILDKEPTKLFPGPQATICLLSKIAFEIPFE